MVQNRNIPQGYKESPLGIIPQEWEVKRLGAIAKCFSGGTPKSETENMYGGIIPFIRSGEIHSNKTALFLTEEGLKKSSAKMVEVGDLIFALYGANSGDCAISQINGAINQAILCIRSSKVINPFLQPYLELQKDMFIAKYLQGGQGNLSGEIVNSYTIPVPPMGEQRKIAEILGVWDEAIEKQSRLIERLEVRKRALMLRLLTGRTRLSVFTTPWQKIKLGEAGIFLSTNTLSRDKLNDNDGYIQNIHYGDILVKYPSIVDAQLTAIPYINKGMDVSSDYMENGDVVFSDTAEDSIVGKAIEISNIADNKIVAGLHTMLFRPNKGCYAQYFLGYYLNSDAYRKQLAPLIQGIKVCSISKKAISQTVLETPSLPEQKAIAEVLTAADNEIATHRKRLEALRLQKHGLMQQLLTGKTRVKI